MEKPIISGSGIRGVFGSSLTVESAMAFASCFGDLMGRREIVVGRDTRSSGEAVEAAVIAGLCSVGCTPILLGVAPTPTIQLETIRIGASGGIAVTSSHNPGEWNALKLIGPDGVFLRRAVREKLLGTLAEARPAADSRSVGRPRVLNGSVDRHASFVAGLDWVAREGRDLRVVLDVTGGTAGTLAPALLSLLGVRYTIINGDMLSDGSFPRVAEPTSENLDGLSCAVSTTCADLGFAFDPDGDRLALVADGGMALSEEFTVALALDCLLPSRPGPAVVNLSTSMLSEDASARHGRKLFRSPVGEVNVVEEMEARESLAGGEGNGGVVDRLCHPGRDSAVGMACIVTLLRTRGCSLSELVATYPRYSMIKRKVRPSRPFEEIIPALESAFGRPDDIRDGLWFARDGGWLHIRPSGTEPGVRFIAENRDPEILRSQFEDFERTVSG
jgi:phosphomannomutase